MLKILDAPLPSGDLTLEIPVPGRPFGLELLLVVDDGVARAYLNSCPHTGVALNWRPDDFRDQTGQYLRCATHGAMFEPASGRCVAGPCTGRNLVEIKIETVDGALYVVDLAQIPLSAKR